MQMMLEKLTFVVGPGLSVGASVVKTWLFVKEQFLDLAHQMFSETSVRENLFAFPARLGGLGISNPVHLSSGEFNAR